MNPFLEDLAELWIHQVSVGEFKEDVPVFITCFLVMYQVKVTEWVWSALSDGDFWLLLDCTWIF